MQPYSAGVDQARANPLDNFRLVFNDKFISTMVARMDDNEDLFKRVLDDREFQAAVMEHYLRRVFEQARGADTSGPPAPPSA